MPNSLPIRLFAIALVLGLAPARADDASAPSLLFTASDLPRLASGVTVPQAAEYHVRVWAPEAQTWSLDADGQTVTLHGEGPEEARPSVPSWQNLGPVKLSDDCAVGVGDRGREIRPRDHPGELPDRRVEDHPRRVVPCTRLDLALGRS